MNFGSSYVYVYDNPEYEVISDEELEEGMHLRYIVVNFSSSLYKNGTNSVKCDTTKKSYIFEFL